MPANTETRLIIGFESGTRQVEGVTIAGKRVLTLNLPETSPQHITLAANDLRAVLESIEKHPEQHVELQNALRGRDLSTAFGIANAVGVTESALAARGGQLVGLLIVIAIAAAVLLESDSPSQPAPAPAPDGGTPNGGAPDAGPG